MLCYIELKFCIWLSITEILISYYRSSSSVVNLRQFLWELCLLEIRILEIHSFPHDSLTFFDILSWNLAYDFVYCTTDQVRVSSICVNFYGSYAPFGTYITGNTVFRTFLLHDLTYWADILHMTLLYCTTDQVRLSVNLRQFLWELCPFWNLECWKYTVFRTSLTCFDGEVRWIGCFTSQLTIFQSYMWRHMDVQADWRRSWTYGRAPNAIDIS